MATVRCSNGIYNICYVHVFSPTLGFADQSEQRVAEQRVVTELKWYIPAHNIHRDQAVAID